MIAVGGRARLRIGPGILDVGQYNFTCILQDHQTGQEYDKTKNKITIEKPPYEPTFKKRLSENYKLNENSTIKLECIVDSKPPSDFSWSLNGAVIEPHDQRFKILSKQEDRSELTIQRVDKNMTGILKFIARNSRGTCRCSTRVEIKSLPLMSPKFLSNSMIQTALPGGILEIVEQEDLTFDVEVSGDPSPIVTWLFNEERFEPDEHEGIIIVSDGNKHSLTIQQVQYNEDSGRYTVHLKNAAGAISTSCQVKVLPKEEEKSQPVATAFKPEILKNLPPNMTLSAGIDALTLSIEIKANPIPNSMWLIGGEMVADEYVNNKIEGDHLKSVLQIPEVSDDLNGETAECLVENELGRVEMSTVLTVKSTVSEKPNIVLPLDDQIFGNLGDTLILKCQVAKPFNGQIEWQKNDIKQSKYRRGQIMAYDPESGTATLTIEELSEIRHNKARFKCIFKSADMNQISFTEGIVYVNKKGQPTATFSATPRVSKKPEPVKPHPSFIQKLPEKILFDEGKLTGLSVIVDKNFDTANHHILLDCFWIGDRTWFRVNNTKHTQAWFYSFFMVPKRSTTSTRTVQLQSIQ